ncbi:MAG: sigma-54-dependent transcriptional regulator [Desulfobacterales bacterium]
MRPQILIVDDEADMLRLLKRVISREMDSDIETAQSAEEALRIFEKKSFDLALLDIRMPGMDGMELLVELKARVPWLTVLMMTAYGAIEVAVEAIKKGAYDFITKPFDHDEIIHHIGNALERGRLIRENLNLKARIREKDTWQGFVGTSPVMSKVYDTIDMLAKTDVTVLITGASGTGKNLAARAIHELGSRNGRPFVRVSCPTVPENILESELFGYSRGAFTHAAADRKGLFEAADGGTIFLDEIGDISPSIQTKLLQVLEEKEFKPLGQTRSVKVDVRVIAATNRNLRAKLDNHEFREDLYFRLCVVELPLPSLKERRDDIPLLVDYFIERFCKEFDRSRKKVSPEVLAHFMGHDWKGNVRELENLVKRAVVMTPGEVVTLADIGWSDRSTPAAVCSGGVSALPYREAKQALLDEFNHRYIREALEQSAGNVTHAAQSSGLERQSFQQIMRKCGIRSDNFRKGAIK